jgi:hypothetical protein
MQTLENSMTQNLRQPASIAAPNSRTGIKKQLGMTLIGSLLVAAALVLAAIVAIKIVPAYIEYFSVKTVLHGLAKEPLSMMTPKEIMSSFDKRTDTAYIDVVSSKDLIIAKNSVGETVLTIDYQVRKPIMGNVSVLIDFNVTTDKP